MASNPPSSCKPGADTHLKYLHLALSEAKKSPQKPTNYRVGAILINPSLPLASQILSTGYTLELPGNTHAEQCCLFKLSTSYNSPSSEADLPSTISSLPDNLTLYTTMEPCSYRLSGNLPCAQRIISFQNIKTVVVGVAEPETFVKENTGRKMLEAAGIEFVHFGGLENEILEVATAGHVKRGDNERHGERDLDAQG